MYIYWLKPQSRPFHDIEQPDDRPTMTFDIEARMGEGRGGDHGIDTDHPRRIIACVFAGHENMPLFAGESTKRKWFRRPQDKAVNATPVFFGPVNTEKGLENGYVALLANFGQAPQYSLSGNVHAIIERVTVVVKGPHSKGCNPSDLNESRGGEDEPREIKDPQEYTELLANRAWEICSTTWTKDFECPD